MKRYTLKKAVKTLILSGLYITIACLGLASCSDHPTAPLRIGTNRWLGYEPLYLARDLGLHQNLAVKLVELPSNTESMHELRSGNLEAAALTLDEALLLAQQGLPIRIVLILDQSAGADALLAKSQVTTLEKLRGQRVGVENSAGGVVLLDSALHRAGLSIADITLVPLEMDQHEQAFIQGQVDAIVTFEPMRTRLVHQQRARVLFDSRDLPGQIVDVLVIRADLATHYYASLQQVIQAHYQTLTHIREQPEVTAQRMSLRQRLAVADILASYRLLHLPDVHTNHEWLSNPECRLWHNSQRLAHTLHERQLLPSSEVPRGLVGCGYTSTATPPTQSLEHR